MGTLYSYNCVLMKWFTTGFTSVDPFSNCSEFIFVGVHTEWHLNFRRVITILLRRVWTGFNNQLVEVSFVFI